MRYVAYFNVLRVEFQCVETSNSMRCLIMHNAKIWLSGYLAITFLNFLFFYKKRNVTVRMYVFTIKFKSL